jgi:hypothetical protein
VSRGIDTTLIVPACALTWKMRTTSDRCPETLPAPVSAATWPVRPARESEPMTSTLNGLPGISASQTFFTTPQNDGFCSALYFS